MRAARHRDRDLVSVCIECFDVYDTVTVNVVDAEGNVFNFVREAKLIIAVVAMTVCYGIERTVVVDCRAVAIDAADDLIVGFKFCAGGTCFVQNRKGDIHIACVLSEPCRRTIVGKPSDFVPFEAFSHGCCAATCVAAIEDVVVGATFDEVCACAAIDFIVP